MLKAGQIVKSVAGHDKNKFYVVVEAREDSVAIANGKARKLAKPKKKNILHIKKTNDILEKEMFQTDKKLRKALANYCGKIALDCGETEECEQS